MDTQKNAKLDLISRAISMKELGIASSDSLPAVEQQFAQYVRSLLQSKRQGTVGVKGRSDVSLTNKKPWKQKGTGRARAGTARSPLWRGGGVTFGPQKRSRVLSIPRKSKKMILAHMLIERLKSGQVIMLDWKLLSDKPKTKEAAKVLRDASLSGKKLTLLLSPNDMLYYSSFVNIPAVQILLFDQPNAYDWANCEYIVFFKKDFDAFKEAIKQWQ